jgi:glycosyltransferase involved in cell wall biosynthesis
VIIESCYLTSRQRAEASRLVQNAGAAFVKTSTGFSPDPAAMYEDVQLILTGGQTGDDKQFLKEVHKKIKKNGLTSAVDFHKNFEGEGRKEFFARTSMISVPVRNGEAFGIYIAESMASGIPVIQPALGAFPELISLTGGGIIYQQNNPETLMSSLKKLLDHPDNLKQLSVDARLGAEKNLDINKLCLDLIELYRQVRTRHGVSFNLPAKSFIP